MTSAVRGRPHLPLVPPGPMPLPSAWNLFCFTFVGLSLVWLPLSVLEKIDALLAFLTWREVLHDVGLAVLLLSACAAILSALAWGVGTFARLLKCSERTIRQIRWAFVYLPIALLCAAQFLYAAKLWIESVTPLKLTLATPYKRGMLLALAVLVVLSLCRFGTLRVARSTVESALAMQFLAIATLAAATAFMTWHPPTIGQAPPLARGPAPTEPLPDIFLITVDSLAAEDANLCKPVPSTMPHLQRLAARSSCFTNFRAVSTITQPTTTTIETATLPWTHWVIQGGRVPPHLAEQTLGTSLRKVGYSTHTISAAAGASPLNRGTHAGYDSSSLVPSKAWYTKLNHVLHVFPDARSLPYLVSIFTKVAEEIDIHRLSDENPFPPELAVAQAQAIVEGSSSQHPLFVWVHLWPPHAPYLPPPSTKYKLLQRGELETWGEQMAQVDRYPPSAQPMVDKHRLRYRESILAVDEVLGKFLDGLQRTGRLDKALVIVTADHGESFERGLFGHSSESLHEAAIRIPLLIKLPGQQAQRTIEAHSGQADLTPTVLDLTGQAPLPQAEGRSLLPLLMGEASAALPIFSMSVQRESRFRPMAQGHYTVLEGRYKLVYHHAKNQSGFYDLEADPKELRDLTSDRPEISSRLLALVKSRIRLAEAERQRHFGGPGPALP
ncbi:sulfatase-like hydrolase/transferase [Rhizobacter sp. J219]|uniref:sulfatase family protein n=1 Tax=Rhizobacter sp. J219 TaxID=2898430 RepID=UPI002151720F|nr:sulfatase-like hydrolase/transferase [Rhizobacter sp. J219]MCR5885731.1 sulfatase-like hydrolase/transferase [Rhizobacter sp. J219]